MFSFFYSYVSFVQNSNREKWQNEDYEIIEWHAGNYFSIFLIFWLILVGIDKFRLLLINFDCFWWTLIDNQCFLLIVIDSKRLVTHEVAKFNNGKLYSKTGRKVRLRYFWKVVKNPQLERAHGILLATQTDSRDEGPTFNNSKLKSTGSWIIFRIKNFLHLGPI